MEKIKTIKNFRSTHNVLIKPLTVEEAKERMTKDFILKEKVLITFSDIVNNDIEWLNDTVSDKILDSPFALTDISFDVMGRTTNNDLIIKVTGSIADYLDDLDAFEND